MTLRTQRFDRSKPTIRAPFREGRERSRRASGHQAGELARPIGHDLDLARPARLRKRDREDELAVGGNIEGPTIRLPCGEYREAEQQPWCVELETLSKPRGDDPDLVEAPEEDLTVSSPDRLAAALCRDLNALAGAGEGLDIDFRPPRLV